MTKARIILQGGGSMSKVFIDGKYVKGVRDVRACQAVGGVPTLTVTYACTQQLTIEGEYDVTHQCPWGDDDTAPVLR